MGPTSFFFYPVFVMSSPKKRKTIGDTNLIRSIFLLLFLLGNSLSFAQHYYAANGLGEMELLNDSTYIISFYGYNGIDYYDTVYYY